MLRPVFFLAILLLFTGLAGCDSKNSIQGSGTVVEEQRALENFSEIELQGGYTVVLTQGPPSLVIEADDNLMPYIKSEVKRGTLIVSNTEDIDASAAEGVTIRISYPELEKLEIGGAANISNEGTIEGKNLDILVSGAANVDLQVAVRKLELDLSGAASVNLAGTSRQLDAEMSGAGNLDAYELQVRDASVQLSGIGGAQLYVTDNLQANVSGVGGIRYKGNPKNIQQQVSGVGSIEASSANDQQ